MHNAAPEYTRELAYFLHGLQTERLPAEVLDRARYFLVDYLSVAIRGSREQSAKAAQGMVRRAAPTPLESRGATILGTPLRTTAAYAAFANGTASHGIEMDDTHSGGSVHLGTSIYSVALAVAETVPDVSWDRFLTAVVAGFEATARIAMAVQPNQQYALGFHPTQTCGVFGAAITAAKLLVLTAEQTLSCMGIAGSMAAGSMEFLAEGAWTKRIHPGLAAQNGIHAAMLAAENFIGPRRILEGRDGFLHGYSRDPIPERLTARLGESYEILHTAVKPHACCRYMQGPIDAALALMRETSISLEQIRTVEVAVLEAGWGLVCEPREKKYHPASVVDAQFSMPFGAAVALMFGAAGLDEFTLEHIHSPSVLETMNKVVLVKDSRIEEAFPREWPARVTIRLFDGRSLEKFVRHPQGDPENPLTWEEMAAKFRALAGTLLPAESCTHIVESVRGSFGEPAELPGLCCAAGVMAG